MLSYEAVVGRVIITFSVAGLQWEAAGPASAGLLGSGGLPSDPTGGASLSPARDVLPFGAVTCPHCHRAAGIESLVLGGLEKHYKRNKMSVFAKC